MGKYKNAAYGCYEMWIRDKENPDWYKIGKVNCCSSAMAEDLAKGWEAMQDEEDYYVEWIN